MNILVTGGSGFIGRNIVEYFKGGHTVLAPTHGELELTDEDAVRQYFSSHKIDIVIHSATKPGHRNAKDATRLFHNNTRMFFNLARCAGSFQKMLVLSSGAIYDMRYYQPKMREEYFDTHVPDDEHGLSKYVCAKYLERTDNIVELRLFGVFGKYEDYAIRFISNAICKTLFDLPITLRQNRRFDYLFVDDLMPILEHFLFNKGEFSSYNVTPDHAVELKLLAEKVKSISKKNLPIVIAQDGMGMEYSGDNTRLHREMPTLVFAPIDIAIATLFRWYQENMHSIDRECLLVDK